MSADEATISGGGYSITLVVTSLSHTLDKQLIIFPIPNKGQDDTLTFLIDLRRCKEAVTIQGYILDASGNTGLTQKAQLINLCRKTAQNLTLSWGAGTGTETMTGNIQKVDIKEEPGRLTASSPGAENKRFNVQLVFVRGTHRG